MTRSATILYLRPHDPVRTSTVIHADHFRRALEALPDVRVVDFLSPGLCENLDSRARRDAVERWVRERAASYRVLGEDAIVHAEIGNPLHREFWSLCFLQRALPRARFFATIHDPPKLSSNPYRYIDTEFAGKTPLRLLNVALTKGAEMIVQRMRMRIERRTMARCEAVFVLSEGGAGALRHDPRFEGVPVHRTRMAVPPLSEGDAPMAVSEDVGVAFFGFISPGRGIEDLVDAFDILCDRLKREHARRGARLLIFGGLSHGARGIAEYVDTLRGRVASSPHAGRISFLPGFVDEAECARRLMEVEVVVQPYRDVSGVRFSSGSAIWALARDKVIVASRTNTLQEVVRDGETGLTYPEADCEALADCLFRLCLDDALRKGLQRGAREWIAREHSTQRIAADLAHVYFGADAAISSAEGKSH